MAEAINTLAGNVVSNVSAFMTGNVGTYLAAILGFTVLLVITSKVMGIFRK